MQRKSDMTTISDEEKDEINVNSEFPVVMSIALHLFHPSLHRI